MQKKDCIAMLLAGGQGSRLYALTKGIAKPAVGFGGNYRIIDFTLSNCINSGIDTVGVLTQYQPLELNRYIGNGAPWDLNRLDGGVHILPPYQRNRTSEWYKGTANAIYQNLNFIDEYAPENVVILSGDHIYKMDYSKMLDFHIAKAADCTIAVLEVDLSEASRFGIMNTNPDGSIYEFEEKPKNPKSTKASMGVYIFKYSKLKEFLIQDEKTPGSSNDFGKNIIPSMLATGQRMFAYPFEGYWKDVGTIESLWEANMDIIDPRLPIDLSDKNWRIYYRNPAMPPHYIAEGALVENSVISGGCNILGEVDFSVLFFGVTIEKGAVVKDSILMNGVTVKKGAVVQYAIVGENSVIGSQAVIGERPENVEDKNAWGITVIGPDIRIASGCKIEAKEMVEEDRNGGAAV